MIAFPQTATMPGTALLELAGFFLGIVLHAFLVRVVLRRRPRAEFERLLLILNGALLAWFAGNFVAVLLRQMDLERVGPALQWVEAASFSALAVLPATLLHTHWHYLRRRFPALAGSRPRLHPLVIALYGTLAALPSALPYLFTDPSIAPIQRLGPFRLPFLLVLLAAYLGSLQLQLRVYRESRDPVEKRLFSRLMPMFLAIPLFTLWVFESGAAEGPGQELLVALALMASLLPSCVVAYYIYRFQFLQIQVHRSLASALLVLAVMGAYLWGIRRLVALLETELGAPGLLLEATFLACLLLLFPTVSNWVQGWVSRAFTEEMLHFRKVAEKLQELSLTTIAAPTYRAAAETLLCSELPATTARILPADSSADPGLLPLRSATRQVGWLDLKTTGPDTPGRREGIRLICSELAAALERCELLERHLALQRELSRRSRLEELGRMAAAVAHNVGNPLSSMKTLLQLRAESPAADDEEKLETRMIVDEVDRLARTVASLLRFSRSDTPPPIAHELVNLHALVDGLLVVLRGKLEDKRLTAVWTSVAAEGCEVAADRIALSEIFSNLLINAAEASPTGGRIELGLTRVERGFELTLTDQGPGIPEDLRDKVLEPFVTTKATGTGLGLAICRRRIEELGGRFRLEPAAAGTGLRAVVFLPAREG